MGFSLVRAAVACAILERTSGLEPSSETTAPMYLKLGMCLNICDIRARGYKTFFMLNSVEHEFSNAHKYKNIKKFSFCQAQISGECYFSCS